MKIYIASRWKSQQRLRAIVAELQEAGHVVTSRWIFVDRPEDPTPEFFKANGHARAEADIADLIEADMLVLDLLDGRGRRGGMMFETGYATALNKDVIVVGDADCVFTQLFNAAPDWKDVMEILDVK